VGGNTYKLGVKDGRAAERKDIIQSIKYRICLESCQHVTCLESIAIIRMLKNGQEKLAI
jgi:hypothetical protein